MHKDNGQGLLKTFHSKLFRWAWLPSMTSPFRNLWFIIASLFIHIFNATFVIFRILIYVLVFFCSLCYVLLVYLSIPKCYTINPGRMGSPNSFFKAPSPTKNYSSFSWILSFGINFNVISTNSVKNPVEIVIVIAYTYWLVQ